MGDFFRGWRRKLGAVALVAASALTVGWVRSLSYCDYITIPVGGVSAVIAISTDGHLLVGVSQFTDKNAIAPSPQWIPLNFQAVDSIEPRGDIVEMIVDLRFHRAGIMALKSLQAGSLLLMAPYWLLTIPLTFISLWMFLNNPGTSASMRTPKSHQDEGEARK